MLLSLRGIGKEKADGAKRRVIGYQLSAREENGKRRVVWVISEFRRGPSVRAGLALSSRLGMTEKKAGSGERGEQNRE